MTHEPSYISLPPEEIERIGMINDIELKIEMLMHACGTVEEAGAAWAAISSALSQSARDRITQLGGDIDAVRSLLDSYFLEHPEA